MDNESLATINSKAFVVCEEAPLQTELELKAMGLWESFGCADLLWTEDGRWLVLEVNTDGDAIHLPPFFKAAIPYLYIIRTA